MSRAEGRRLPVSAYPQVQPRLFGKLFLLCLCYGQGRYQPQSSTVLLQGLSRIRNSKYLSQTIKMRIKNQFYLISVDFEYEISKVTFHEIASHLILMVSFHQTDYHPYHRMTRIMSVGNGTFVKLTAISAPPKECSIKQNLNLS